MGWTIYFGKAEGIVGKMFLNSMNSGHTPISKWGLKHLYAATTEEIL